QSSVSEMRAEETGRQRAKEYSQTLLKLNIAIRNVLSEMELEKILPAVAANLHEALRADLVGIYLRDERVGLDPQTEFSLRHAGGASHAFKLADRVALRQVWEI